MIKYIFVLFLLIGQFLNAQKAEREIHSSPHFVLAPYANGFTNTVAIKNVGDERLFVVEQQGVIKILLNSNTNATPFLDISPQVTFSEEEGLLNIAFHPDYSSNGYFYINYINSDGNTQISRFTVSTDPNIADVSTELDILTINQPFSNNNGGELRFGPDGYLWIGTGDGGGSIDPQNNAQNQNSLLGKMLRIDINNTANGNNYSIPPDNPYIADPEALNEIWARGLRNPKNFDFNTNSGEVWIADGGQNNKLELNKALINESGLNYGWRCYEVNDPFNIDECEEENTMTFPFIEYDYTDTDCKKVGGIVYKGEEFPYIQSSYIFSDNCNSTLGAVIGEFDFFIDGPYPFSFTSFGEDFENNLYVASTDGSIQKLFVEWLNTEEFFISSFKITPNPTDSFLQISCENAMLNSILIYDAKGKKVYSEQDSLLSNKVINVSNLSSGLYIVKASTAEGASVSKKLVIK